ncbi:HlyD family efflux transporter periplasmic adaptor subunit [Marispirochaeta aestuarii]|uniref:efflux RND transporter periplasmic adaptor subunit n=1 Tax=Marispirochaeta aestuarii TaxID=1963862 RepID=UPI0029C93D7D|nr:HlyD family efflux transporter periplasmic adaptor subunit [Marispirochaeta aestuarii]
MKRFLKRHKRPVTTSAAVLLLCAALTVYLVINPGKPHASAEKEEARLVETRRLVYEPVAVIIRGEGFIRSARSLTVTAMTGGKVINTFEGLKSGLEVEAGQELILIDDEEAANNLALARMELIRSTASLLSAVQGDGTLYSRWSDFFSRLSPEADDLPPLPEVESDREKLLASNFGVLSAYYGVREAAIRLGYHRVTAPFPGVLEGDGVTLYSNISQGAPLFTLTDPLNLELTAALSRDELGMISPDTQEVLVYPGEMRDISLPGRLVRVDKTMQQESQTVKVHITFRNPDSKPRFFPGNYAEVEIPGISFESAFTLPRALLNPDGTVNTFEEGRLVKYPVEILYTQSETVILAPTLPEGSRIVFTRLQSPLQGMALRRIEEK